MALFLTLEEAVGVSTRAVRPVMIRQIL